MEEEILIAKAKNGHYESFDSLIQPYLQQSYKTAYLILNDYNLAQDFVQESLYQTFKSLNKYDSSKALFKTWFNKIVINTAIKMKRTQFFHLEFQPEHNKNYINSAEHNIIYKEETDILYDNIQRLSTKLKVVIILFYYQELSIKEVAKTLDISEGTVKSRLYKARNKLKDMLEQGDYKWNVKGDDK